MDPLSFSQACCSHGQNTPSSCTAASTARESKWVCGGGGAGGGGSEWVGGEGIVSGWIGRREWVGGVVGGWEGVVSGWEG